MRPSLALAAFALCSACDADDTSSPDDTAPTDEPPPEWCEEAVQGGLHHVLTHPGSPYWIHHPASGTRNPPTVIFLPGGGGDDMSGEGTYRMFFERGSALDDFRVVILTATDGDLTDEWDRVAVAADEVRACYGGGHFHLAGHSNGGLGAYESMLTAYDRFATLLGCPGAWQYPDQAAVTTALADRAVFNGAGEFDSWRSAVEDIHDWLVSLGIDSVFVEFEGQGHVPDESFDQDVLFDFWAAH